MVDSFRKLSSSRLGESEKLQSTRGVGEARVAIKSAVARRQLCTHAANNTMLAIWANRMGGGLLQDVIVHSSRDLGEPRLAIPREAARRRLSLRAADNNNAVQMGQTQRAVDSFWMV